MLERQRSKHAAANYFTRKAIHGVPKAYPNPDLNVAACLSATRVCFPSLIDLAGQFDNGQVADDIRWLEAWLRWEGLSCAECSFTFAWQAEGRWHLHIELSANWQTCSGQEDPPLYRYDVIWSGTG